MEMNERAFSGIGSVLDTDIKPFRLLDMLLPYAEEVSRDTFLNGIADSELEFAKQVEDRPVGHHDGDGYYKSKMKGEVVFYIVQNGACFIFSAKPGIEARETCKCWDHIDNDPYGSMAPIDMFRIKDAIQCSARCLRALLDEVNEFPLSDRAEAQRVQFNDRIWNAVQEDDHAEMVTAIRDILESFDDAHDGEDSIITFARFVVLSVDERGVGN